MIRVEATPESLRVGYFDADAAPVLEIDSGDSVDVQTVTHWGGRLTPDATIDDVVALREEFAGVGPHSVTGPIAVRGARPGHVLKVDILSLDLIDHGFNINLPGTVGTGLLPESIAEGAIRHFSFDDARTTTRFGEDITIDLQPFLGIMAVAPSEGGRLSTVPPGTFGGNMDLRELTAGTTLYLPVWRDGAMFTVGDAHARQGNGEVCLTAIESAIESAKMTLTVTDEFRIDSPMAETPTHWITMGMDPDLLIASKKAVTNMIAFLHSRLGLSETDAYGLCSMVGDLSVTQVVNVTRGAHMSVPKHVFGEGV
ncbi:acetamidase/formamidase family protein [Agromyces bauzanensis]